MNWIPQICIDAGISNGIASGKVINLESASSADEALANAYAEFLRTPHAISFTASKAS